MRHPIETVPNDRKAVILEDDTNGTYELAQWSAQECAWVGENGKPCKITPMYWHAMQRAEHVGDECKSSSPLQTGILFPNLDAEPQPASASLDVFAPDPVASSESVSVAGFDKQIPRGQAHPAQAGRRFAACCGAAMVAASLSGMYFRGDVAAYVTQHADRADELGIASVPQDVPMEQPRKISLTADPTLRQAAADADSVPALATQITVGQALTQSPENHRPADDLENELFKAHQALAEAQERETQLKQTAETARTELQQSLDKIASLKNALALEQHSDQASLSSRRARRIPQRRLKHPYRQDFFGVFNFAPNRPSFQRYTRSR